MLSIYPGTFSPTNIALTIGFGNQLEPSIKLATSNKSPEYHFTVLFSCLSAPSAIAAPTTPASLNCLWKQSYAHLRASYTIGTGILLYRSTFDLRASDYPGQRLTRVIAWFAPSSSEHKQPRSLNLPRPVLPILP